VFSNPTLSNSTKATNVKNELDRKNKEKVNKWHQGIDLKLPLIKKGNRMVRLQIHISYLKLLKKLQKSIEGKLVGEICSRFLEKH
jgi:hypothetical protein